MIFYWDLKKFIQPEFGSAKFVLAQNPVSAEPKKNDDRFISNSINISYKNRTALLSSYSTIIYIV